MNNSFELNDNQVRCIISESIAQASGQLTETTIAQHGQMVGIRQELRGMYDKVNPEPGIGTLKADPVKIVLKENAQPYSWGRAKTHFCLANLANP